MDSAFKIFWVGFLIYTISFTLTYIPVINDHVANIFKSIGILLFIPAAINQIQWKFESKYLMFVFSLYCLCVFTVILRGFNFDLTYIKIMLTDPFEGIFSYICPLILLFPLKPGYLKNIFKIIVILSISYIVIAFIVINLFFESGVNLTSQSVFEYTTKTLSLPIGFILLTYPYQSKNRTLLAFFTILLIFFFSAIRARRGLMFVSINMLVFSYFIYFYLHKMKFFLFTLSLLLISTIYFFGTKIYSENQSGIFSYISDRLNEGIDETRSGVEDDLFQDMEFKDWVIGKGINGSYYSPGLDGEDFRDYRTGIETDYLAIILKGGLINLGLLLLIAIPAIFKGLFYSRNILSKAAGIWILLYLFDLYPLPVTDFTLNYLLVWISIGICYSNTIRNIPENKMNLLLIS